MVVIKIEPIDKLQIQIEAQSKTAVKGIDALATSLQTLRNAAKGGIGLTTVTRQLTRFAEAVDKIKAPTQKIQALADSLKPLETIGKSNLGSTLNQLKKIPDITSALGSENLREFAEKIQEVTLAVAPLATEMEKVSQGFSKLPANIQRAINANAKLTKSNTKTAFSFNMMAAKIGIIALAARKVGRVLSGWINESTEYVENLNLFTITMGENMEQAKKYAEEVGDAVGIDPSQFMRFQAVFQNMTMGFGIAADKASIMSKNLTTLGYDLASVFNVKFETAMQKLESALAGQPRPMREWGFDLSEATLKAVALEKGISKNVETMVQMEKAQIRYIQLIETAQKLNLTGNFSRELLTTANQIRVFQAQVKQAARALGNIFIPVLNAVLPYLTAMLMIIRKIAQEIANMFGFELPEIDYSGLKSLSGTGEELEGVFDDATESAEEFKRAVLGFDELNILNFNKNASQGLDTGNLIDLELPEYDFLKDLTENETKKLAEKLEKPFRKILEIVVAIGAGILAWKIGTGFINSLAHIKSSLAILGGTGVGSIGGVITKLAGAAGLVASMILANKHGKELARALHGDSSSSLSGALLSLVGDTALGALGGFMLFGGPIGTVIGGLAGIASGIVGLIAEENRYIRESVFADNFSKDGVKVEEFSKVLSDLFKPYTDYTDRQSALNSQLEIAKTRFNEADIEVAGLLSTLENRENLDSTDIERMRTAFNNLFDSFNEVASLNFDIVLGGLSQAITLNLGSRAQAEIAGMITQLQLLKRELDIAVSEEQKRVNETLDRGAERGYFTPEESAALAESYRKIGLTEHRQKIEDTELIYLINKLRDKGLGGEDLEEVLAQLKEIQEQYDKVIKGITLTGIDQKKAIDAMLAQAAAFGIDTSTIKEEDLKKVLDEAQKQIVSEVTIKYQETFNAITKEIEEMADKDRNQFIEKYSEGFWGLITDSMTRKIKADNEINKRYGDIFNIIEALAAAFSANSTPMASGGRVGSFATGGVVSKPTLAYVGEYAGASTDPEIITPQSTMYETVVEANTPMVSAIVTAIQSLERTVKDKDSNIELDGETISKSVISSINDYTRRTGRNPINAY